MTLQDHPKTANRQQRLPVVWAAPPADPLAPPAGPRTLPAAAAKAPGMEDQLTAARPNWAKGGPPKAKEPALPPTPPTEAAPPKGKAPEPAAAAADKASGAPPVAALAKEPPAGPPPKKAPAAKAASSEPVVPKGPKQRIKACYLDGSVDEPTRGGRSLAGAAAWFPGGGSR